MLIKKSKTAKKQADKTTTVWEYDFASKNLGFATAKINGRHPGKGRIINTKCDIIYYVISGSGMVNVKKKNYHLTKGDSLYIKKGSPYYIKGKNLFIVLPTSPAWTVKQFREIK